MLLLLFKVENSSFQESVHACIYVQGTKPLMPRIPSCLHFFLKVRNRSFQEFVFVQGRNRHSKNPVMLLFFVQCRIPFIPRNHHALIYVEGRTAHAKNPFYYVSFFYAYYGIIYSSNKCKYDSGIFVIQFIRWYNRIEV
jgi:hypothetical protein